MTILTYVIHQSFDEDWDNAPNSLKFKLFKIYTGLLALLFAFKIIYYSINILLWCNPSIDPRKKFAKRRFKMMIIVGTYQFIMFISGIVLFLLIDKTREHIRRSIMEEDGWNSPLAYLMMKIILLTFSALLVLEFIAQIRKNCELKIQILILDLVFHWQVEVTQILVISIFLSSFFSSLV